MKPIDRSEVLGLAEYESVRDRFRARVVGEKRLRRLHLGDRVTVVFENRDTVLLQIQEMLRTERITKASSVAHEIATYNELVPGDDELSVTLMIEIDDAAERDSFLSRAIGFEKAVAVVVNGEPQRATYSAARELEDRASAVQYLKFPLTAAAAAALKAGNAKVTLRADHPAFTAEAPLPAPLIATLAEELTDV